MKSVLIGSVLSSQIMLQSMIDTGFPVDMVFSLDEKVSNGVSGYYPIHETAEKNHIPYTKFTKINSEENIRIIEEIQPDYIFVIGLSQLIPQRMIDVAKEYVIGFHPTPLPKFRGRAVMVWQLLLNVKESAVTLFRIDEGMDSGDILGQESYYLDENDYAEDAERKYAEALSKLAPRVLNSLKDGTMTPVKQNEAEATYCLIRREEDGHLAWNEQDVKELHTLIRAVSRPYPGAYGMYDGEHKIIIWKADVIPNTKYIGLPGQIISVGENSLNILCRDGILAVSEYENVDQVKLFAGHKLK